jgi:hypothetical protein
MQNVKFENLFTDGYLLHKDDSIDIGYFDQFSFPDCNQEGEMSLDLPEEGFNRLTAIHKYLAETYVAPVFPDFEIKEHAIWNGVDSGSSRWHNDFEDGDPFNLTFLIYLDDNTEENGNHLAVRGPAVENTIYPKRGEFICLNQKRIFYHKACHKSGMRRILGFEFFIPALA